MPIPEPDGQSEKKYIPRCMSALKDEFPNRKQRLAVCYSKLRKAGRKVAKPK